MCERCTILDAEVDDLEDMVSNLEADLRLSEQREQELQARLDGLARFAANVAG